MTGARHPTRTAGFAPSEGKRGARPEGTRHG